MWFKKRFISSLIAAALTTGLLYWIDDDPPYTNRLHTLMEVAIITAVLFVVFLGVSYLVNRRTAARRRG